MPASKCEALPSPSRSLFTTASASAATATATTATAVADSTTANTDTGTAATAATTNSFSSRYPTALALAGGAPAPIDPVSDGFDLSDYLFGSAADSPRTQFFYHATTSSLPHAGLMALREGKYKIHLYTQGSHCTDDYYDQACWDATLLANHTANPLL